MFASERVFYSYRHLHKVLDADDDDSAIEPPETQSWLARWWTESNFTIGAGINSIWWFLVPPKFTIDAKKIAGGAPIFRFNTGVKCIAATDYVSAEFLLSAPNTVLDRENVPRFGSVGKRFI